MILVLRVLTKRRWEFWQELLAADVDLCKSFESVNGDSFWEILGLRSVPPKVIDLISERYSGTESAAKCAVSISDSFPHVTEICQECVLVLTLLVLGWTGFW